MDYDKYLLSKIREVSEEDVIHVIIEYLVQIFDPSSMLAITCPTNKLDSIHDYFVKRGWKNLKKVKEEDLFTAFVAEKTDDEAPLPDKVPGMSMFLPGAFAAQFKCDCPRCL